MEYCNTFKSLFKSERLKEFIKTALQIKKADKSASVKLKILSVVTCVGMTVLGYFAFRNFTGAIIFLIISYVSTFSLTLSMKKKALLAYLKHYRENLLLLLANLTKTAKPDTPDSLNLLFPNTMHHWTLCYEKNTSFIGFARLYENSREIANGCAVCSGGMDFSGTIYKGYFPSISEEFTEDAKVLGAPSDDAREFAAALDAYFNSYALIFSEKASLLFLPTATDFMSGRVETPDDVEPKALARQLAYVGISEAFGSLDKATLCNALELFDIDLSEEIKIYESIKKSIK